MSDLRIQVCEWLGWTQIREQDYCEPHVNPYDGPVLQYWEGVSPEGERGPLPELTLDLMHQAESRLTDEEHVEFQSHLWDATEPEGVKEADVRDVSNLLDQWERARTSPTAEQRAAALLRAVKEKGAA